MKFINNVAHHEKLDVIAYQRDLTRGIPKIFLRKFDVFLTDPTPSPQPFEVFISIGLALLKDGEEQVGYVSFFPSHQARSLNFQEIMTRKRITVTDIIPRFTEYAFLQATYHKEDIKLLKKYASGKDRLSFHENLCRFETSKSSVRDVISVKPKAMLGKATARTIANPENDPAYLAGEKRFVLSVVKRMKKLSKL